MRILFSSRPAYGHLYPLMPLALAARDAGHDVAFATSGAFLLKLQALGFETHDVGYTIEEAFAALGSVLAGDGVAKRADGRPDPEVGGQLFIDVIGHRTATDLAPVVDAWEPDVVIYEQGEFGAAVVAGVAGIPAVCHSISPRMPADLIAVVSGERVEQLWAAVGASAPLFDIFTGNLFIDIFPAVLQPSPFLADPARVPMRPIPWAEPAAPLPRWVGARSRPLVYLTLGTIVATDEVLVPAIEGLATLDADILVALGSAAGDELGPLPTNVHVEAFVNQAALFRHAALVVHHGGSGTVLGALTHGTPQVLLPKGADQFLNADAVAKAGLAAVLEPSQVTPDAVATMAKAALEEHRPAVDAVRAELAAMPHPARVVGELERKWCPSPR